MYKLLCPVCQEEGLKSSVKGSDTFTTCAGVQAYWDEDGDYHRHDPNVSTTSYSCSNGHHFTVRTKRGCASCGQGDQKEVEIHKEKINGS
jgi:hypothetical protein